MEPKNLALENKKNLGNTFRKACGFTIVEILIAVTVLGVAAAFIVPRFFAKPDPAKQEAARRDTAAIAYALLGYKYDNGQFPTAQQGLNALVKKPTTAPIPPSWKDLGYLEKLPLDPWNHPYQYRIPGLHANVDVFSLGADGAPGGTGDDADIGAWME